MMERATFSRREFMSYAVSGATFAAVPYYAWGGVTPAQENRPNILLIFADDVGQEVLGCYGGTSYNTPNLDALAAGGVRFRHVYAMPVCHPSRLTLLTGRYPFRLGNPKWGTFPKAEESRTVAHALKQAGYATAVAGKWQLTLLRDDPGHPSRLGFDEYCLFGWHEGPRYHAPLILQNGQVRADVVDRYGPDVYCEFLVDFMSRNRDGPFFAFYSMALCHDVTDDLDAPVPYGPEDRYETYAEMVVAMDVRVGRLVQALERIGLRENTLILYVTDNGTPKATIVSARDGRFLREPVFSRLGDRVIPGGKGDLTDGGTRVPLIVNWPGVVPAGRVVDGLVDLSDFFPTFAELAAASLPRDVSLDGTSFVEVMRGRVDSTRAWVYAEHEQGLRWVRNRLWKLYGDGRLFDMTRDPSELSPISKDAQSEEARSAREQLAAVLMKALVRE